MNVETPHVSPVVLIVDDDPIVRESTHAVLMSQGISALPVAGATEGLEEFRRSAGNIRVVLLDWNLPGTEPAEMMRHLRLADSSVRIIIVTGDISLPKHEIVAAGADQVLWKPFGLSDLLNEVRGALDNAE
ncbi:MAG: response regulator [Planctomycetaceae bacterium]|nr:response regulator [Planctomycetaceae bacterium]